MEWLKQITNLWAAGVGAMVLAALTLYGILRRTSTERMNAYLSSTDKRLTRMSAELNECRTKRDNDLIYIARLETALGLAGVALPSRPE